MPYGMDKPTVTLKGTKIALLFLTAQVRPRRLITREATGRSCRASATNHRKTNLWRGYPTDQYTPYPVKLLPSYMRCAIRRNLPDDTPHDHARHMTRRNRPHRRRCGGASLLTLPSARSARPRRTSPSPHARTALPSDPSSDSRSTIRMWASSPARTRC